MKNEYQELLLEDLTILTAYHAFQHDAAQLSDELQQMYEERIIELCSKEGTIITELYQDWLAERGLRVYSYYDIAPTPLVFVTFELPTIIANFYFYEQCLVNRYTPVETFGTVVNIKFEEDCALGEKMED